jgi:hypothetical protein
MSYYISLIKLFQSLDDFQQSFFDSAGFQNLDRGSEGQQITIEPVVFQATCFNNQGTIVALLDMTCLKFIVNPIRHRPGEEQAQFRGSAGAAIASIGGGVKALAAKDSISNSGDNIRVILLLQH